MTKFNRQVKIRLARIGKDDWTVYGICDPQGFCVAVRFLSELDKALKPQGHKMMRLLKETIPRDGPQDKPSFICEHLDDGILEFKRGPKNGPRLRVLWFYPGLPKCVVCTHAFLKTSRKTPPEEITAAKSARQKFSDAQRRIVTPLLPEFPLEVL